MWSIAEAKSRLSEILRQVRAGEPQIIGSHDPCVIVSLHDYQTKIADADHDGLWLIDHAAQLGHELPVPPRHHDRRDVAFEP